MRKRREIQLFSISFLDLLSGALGAVIILYVAIPKNQTPVPVDDTDREILERQLQSRQQEIQSLEKMLETASTRIKALEAQKVVVPAPVPDPAPGKGGLDVDIGFKFKGKKIVFVIDTSRSMLEEDRMGGVKGGLKMLLTALSPEFEVDVVQFPLGMRAPFKALFGELRSNNRMNREDLLEFIYSMQPNGGTPTRDALLHVLQNYREISDIVLLTDGAPTVHNQDKKDNIYDILTAVRAANTRKVQINAIGVGSSFIKDQTSEQYKFLHILAEQNAGFFVGF